MATNIDIQAQLLGGTTQVTFRDLGGGLNSTPGALSLKDNESSDLFNVDFNKFGSILQRGGYSVFNSNVLSGASQGLYWYKSLYDMKPVTVNNGKIFEMDGMDGTWHDITGQVSFSTGGVDTYTTLMLHFDGGDQSTLITDSSASIHTIVNTETYDSYTTLMLHMDIIGTATSSTVITDSSLGTHTMYVIGSNTALVPTQYKFGYYTLSNSNLYFSGSSLGLLGNSYNMNTVFLSHFDGVDGAMAYTPEVGPALTFNGTAQLDDTQKVFGATSLYLPNDSDYVKYTADSNYNFGTGDFSIEFRVRFTVLDYRWMFSCHGGNIIDIYLENGGDHSWFYNVDGNVFDSGLIVPVINNWYHVLLTRVSGVVKFFINGVQVIANQNIAGALNLSGQDIYIGTQSGFPAFNTKGWFDEVRCVNNTPDWTANFTPPTNPYVLEYVYSNQSNDFFFSNTDFTIDGWMYPTSLANNSYLLGQSSTTNYTWGLQVDSNNNLSISFVNGGATKASYTSSGTNVALNSWQHFAVIRSSTTCSIYLNGASQILTSTTSFGTNDVGIVPSPLYIGVIGNQIGTQGGNYRGYIDELRISKNIIRWNQNFLPYSSAYGKVALVTTTPDLKFGIAGGEFRGYERLSSADSSDWFFSNTDFTVDFWVKFNNITNGAVFAGQYQNATNYWYLRKESSANNNNLHLQFISTTTKSDYTMSGGWSPSINTWYHIAFERYGANALMFINGMSQTLVSTTAFATNDVGDVTATLQIGQQNNANFLDGWMDEFRVSKGIARWTANFTPQSSPYNDLTSGFQRQDFETFLGYVLGSDPTSTPWQWLMSNSTATNMTLFTGLTGAQFIKKFQNYCILANVVVGGTNFPSRFYWSNIKDISTWSAANYIDVSKDDGDVITGLRVLGDRLVVYKNNSIYIVIFTGDADIPFIVQKTNSAVGCSAPYSIQEVNNGHIFAAYDGIYFFDGSNSYKMSDKINDIYAGINKAKLSECVSVYQRTKNQYWLALPSGTSLYNNFVITWNAYLNAWSKYSGISASSLAIFLINNKEERVYFGDYNGYYYRADYGVDDYPSNVKTPPNSYFWTNWKSFDDICDKKGIPHIYINHSAETYTNLTFGYSYDFNVGLQYSSTFPLYTTQPVTALVRRRDLTGRGNFVRFYFGNYSTGTSYRIDGVGTYVTRESKS